MDRSLITLVLLSALVSCASASCSPSCIPGEFCNATATPAVCECDPNETNTTDFDAKVACAGSSATMTLSYCLLSNTGMNIETLHLNNENCTGQVQGSYLVFSFNNSQTCGSTITENSTHIMFHNGVLVDVNTSKLITRREPVQLNMSCPLEISAPEINIPLSLKISDSTMVLNLTSGEWNYTLGISAFQDSQLTQAINSTTELVLNEQIFIDMVATGLDDSGIVVVVDSCWATPNNDSQNTARWDLIKDGCPKTKDKSVVVRQNGNSSESIFSFKMFRFTGSSQQLVFVHCQVDLCVSTQNTCAPSCGSRRRRRSLRNADGAVISMSFNRKD